MGQERRTHSSVAAAVSVRPLPAMDINTSQKSKSQSKRSNRCDLLGFQRLADLFQLCATTCTNATACILIPNEEKTQHHPKQMSALLFLMCPRLLVLFAVSFFLFNESTHHLRPTPKLMRRLGVECFLSEILPS